MARARRAVPAVPVAESAFAPDWLCAFSQHLFAVAFLNEWMDRWIWLEIQLKYTKSNE